MYYVYIYFHNNIIAMPYGSVAASVLKDYGGPVEQNERVQTITRPRESVVKRLCEVFEGNWSMSTTFKWTGVYTDCVLYV